MKIDRETFDFQLRLIKAEVKNEHLTEELEYLKGQNQSNINHNNYLIEQLKDYQQEVKSLNAYIKRFLAC